MSTLHKCHDCNKECVRIKDSWIAKYSLTTYKDENGKRWRSANSCPECSKLYHRRRNGHKPREQLLACKICNKELLSNSPAQLMCSKECATRNALNQQKARLQASKTEPRACRACGKDLTKASKSKHHCNKTCWKLAKPKKAPKPNPIKTCPICKTKFERKKVAAKFCSITCAKKNTLKTKRKYKRVRKKTVASIKTRRHHKKLREMKKRQRLPKWADKLAIKQFYDNCPEGMYVDHILPLAGEEVTGLHTLNNFQYLPLLENSFKNRKWDGTYENESWRAEFEQWKN
jgi:hypothetical protein